MISFSSRSVPASESKLVNRTLSAMLTAAGYTVLDVITLYDKIYTDLPCSAMNGSVIDIVFISHPHPQQMPLFQLNLESIKTGYNSHSHVLWWHDPWHGLCRARQGFRFTSWYTITSWNFMGPLHAAVRTHNGTWWHMIKIHSNNCNCAFVL